MNGNILVSRGEEAMWNSSGVGGLRVTAQWTKLCHPEVAMQDSRSVYQVRGGTQLWGKGATALGSQEEDANRDKHTGSEKQAALLPTPGRTGKSLPVCPPSLFPDMLFVGPHAE